MSILNLFRPLWRGARGKTHAEYDMGRVTTRTVTVSETHSEPVLG